VSKCKHSPALIARNRLKEESLGVDLVFYFSEEAGRAFEDIGFSLSSLEFEIDPKPDHIDVYPEQLNYD